MMAASMRALLTQLIDYAGMFPPASLSLDESIRNYARYANEPDAWMLGRFICPTVKLKELEPYITELFASDSGKLAISALGRGTDVLDDDLAAIQSFGADRVDLFETRIVKGTLVQFAADPRSVFLEDEAEDSIGGSVDLNSRMPFGFKLRTGGVEASAFPPAEKIARAIALCRDKKIRMKFTAGLHHPIRHFNASVNTKMHGFVNVLVAGVLAHALGLVEDQLVPILLDEDAASFRFDDDVVRWKDYGATTQQVWDAREQLVTSYGSCSFDEPRDGLRSLGWL